MNYVYKYRNREQYHLEALRECYFYFSKPSEMNDPFDCYPIIFYDSSKCSENELKMFIMEYKGKRESEIDKQEIQDLIIEFQDFTSPYSDKTKKTSELVNDYLKFFSVSSNPENILMWSYYSDSHKGYCIKIKTEQYDNCNWIAFKSHQFKKISPQTFPVGYLKLDNVNYSKKKPNPINMFQNDSQSRLYQYILDKFEDWSHEEESRLLTHPNLMIDPHIQKIYYNPSIIDGIILGYHCSDELKKELHEINHKHYHNKLKFYQANINAHEYQITID